MKTGLQLLGAGAAVYFCAMIMKPQQVDPAQGGVNLDMPPLQVVDKNSPPSIQMAYYIHKYAEKYSIPLQYAFGIAHAETHYQGPYHWNYNPRQVSPVGALGPMQIMPSTGQGNWKGRVVTREMLLNDIEFNVHTSMKVLRKLHNKYGDWKTVFGCYNTGRPCVNGYAMKVYNFRPSL